MNTPTPALRLGEFIALTALMTSLVALSIDGMLSALPAIGADVRARDSNDAQLVVSSLLLGGFAVFGALSLLAARKIVRSAD